MNVHYINLGTLSTIGDAYASTTVTILSTKVQSTKTIAGLFGGVFGTQPTRYGYATHSLGNGIWLPATSELSTYAPQS